MKKFLKIMTCIVLVLLIVLYAVEVRNNPSQDTARTITELKTQVVELTDSVNDLTLVLTENKTVLEDGFYFCMYYDFVVGVEGGSRFARAKRFATV